MIGEKALERFRGALTGDTVVPGDADYEEARRVWNGMIDRRPAVVARCAGIGDVAAALRFGRDEGLPIAVRGGAHNVAGHATCDGGIVIDLGQMRGVAVDRDRGTARAGPGCTWAEFDRATQEFGLATTGGLVSTTGVAGFTLGGGLGWLMRKHGLTCDNLVSADVTLADGGRVTASAGENAELFWALRGGGGNFGVVTSFELAVHPVGPTVFAGMALHRLDRAAEFLRHYRDVVADLPDELTTMVACITAPPLPFIPEALQGKRMIALALAYCGPVGDAEAAIAPLMAFGAPAASHLGPMPYVAWQSAIDATAPRGGYNYWKAAHLPVLSDGVIDAIVEFARIAPQPMAMIHLHHLGGAVSRVADEETAYANRSARFALNIIGMWSDASDTDAGTAWVRRLFAAVEPSTQGVYVNFLGDEGDDRVRAAYGPKYARLAAIKRRYDPDNLLRLNQNIRPA